MKLSLVTTPNPILNQVTDRVKRFDQQLEKTVKEMERVLIECKDPEGVGLAAPQVGLTLQLFLIKPYPKARIRAFINPKALQTSKQNRFQKNVLEGCLSIRNTWANISRPKWILLQYQDIKGRTFSEKFTGWEAQIIQHEMDHLKGILFTHRALSQQQKLYRIKKNRLNEEELVPIEI